MIPKRTRSTEPSASGSKRKSIDTLSWTSRRGVYAVIKAVSLDWRYAERRTRVGRDPEGRLDDSLMVGHIAGTCSRRCEGGGTLYFGMSDSRNWLGILATAAPLTDLNCDLGRL